MRRLLEYNNPYINSCDCLCNTQYRDCYIPTVFPFRHAAHSDGVLIPLIPTLFFPILLVIPTSFIIFKCFYYAFSYTTVDCSLSYISRVCDHAVSALSPKEGSVTQPQIFHVFTTMNILMSKQNVNGSCEREFNHKLFFQHFQPRLWTSLEYPLGVHHVQILHRPIHV